MEQTQQYCLHSLTEVHKGHINWFRATVQFSVRKGLWFPEQKTSSASLHHPLLVKVKYWWISVINDSAVITWSFCSISLRARRCFWQQLSCTGLTAQGRGSQGAHARSPPRAGHRQCSLHNQPLSCSTGTQLSKPNGLWNTTMANAFLF